MKREWAGLRADTFIFSAGVAGMTCRTERIAKNVSHDAAHTFVSSFYAKSRSDLEGEVLVLDDDGDVPNG